MRQQAEQTGNDTGQSVEVAALGDRIQMRSAPHGLSFAAGIRQTKQEIGSAVGADLESVLQGKVAQESGCGRFALAIAGARDTDAVMREFANFCKQFLGNWTQFQNIHESCPGEFSQAAA